MRIKENHKNHFKTNSKRPGGRSKCPRGWFVVYSFSFTHFLPVSRVQPLSTLNPRGPPPLRRGDAANLVRNGAIFRADE